MIVMLQDHVTCSQPMEVSSFLSRVTPTQPMAVFRVQGRGQMSCHHTKFLHHIKVNLLLKS